MSDLHIKTWQHHLRRRHGMADVVADGRFGPATLAASLALCGHPAPAPADTPAPDPDDPPASLLLDARTERHLDSLDPRVRPTMRHLAELAKVAAAAHNARS